MDIEDQSQRKPRRFKADSASKLRCKTLICVLENPKNIQNVAAVIRNIDTLGVGKLYVVDGYNILPKSWNQMRNNRRLSCLSASSVKWSYVKIFKTTQDCLIHLKDTHYVNMVTSPHIKGLINTNLSKGIYTQSKLAVWFGNEVEGISQTAINNSITCVQIEMSGIVESLNLSVSTGIVLYVIVQQRQNYCKNKLA